MMNDTAARSPAVAVISTQFCAGDSVELTVGRSMHFSGGKFVVKDVNGNIMFTIEGKLFTNRRVLRDAAGNPILTFQPKSWSGRNRWQAFRGESTDANDMLFSVRKSTILQRKKNLDVFLASNTAEEVVDFRIEGSFLKNSCFIYAGGEAKPDDIIVQMHGIKSLFRLEKDLLAMTVYPNVDYAFAVSLVLLLGFSWRRRRAM